MTKDKPDTAETDAAPDEAKDDVISDPAEGAEDRVDWSGEGGATPSGPAPTPRTASERAASPPTAAASSARTAPWPLGRRRRRPGASAPPRA